MSFERRSLQRLRGYEPGKQVTGSVTAKLNANENPFPPSASVEKELRSIGIADLRQYPYATADNFRKVAAEVHDVKLENIMAVNGGDELLRLAMTTFVDPGQPIGTTNPTYVLYSVLAGINESPVCEIQVDVDSPTLPPDAAQRFNEANVSLALITNPHAPSGCLFSERELLHFVNQFKGVTLVDEAYVDFVSPERRYDLANYVDRYDNLVLLRSLSKGYSLAGLRLGYAIGAPGLIAPMMSKTRDSYNVDLIAQRLGAAALKSRKDIEGNLAIVRTERDRIRSELLRRGYRVPESQANYLLIRMPRGRQQALEVKERLERQGILIRHFDDPALNEMLRLSIGLPHQNDEVLKHFDPHPFE